jgi:hypothetical protein
VVQTKRVVLPEGDYALFGYEGECIIERKGSLRELSNNLLSEDWARASDAFQRLADATRNPYLLIECTPAEFLRKFRWTQSPAKIMDALSALIERFGFRPILCGSVKTARQKAVVGELILRIMLAHAFQQETNYGGVEEVINGLREKKGDPSPSDVHALFEDGNRDQAGGEEVSPVRRRRPPSNRVPKRKPRGGKR